MSILASRPMGEAVFAWKAGSSRAVRGMSANFFMISPVVPLLDFKFADEHHILAVLQAQGDDLFALRGRAEVRGEIHLQGGGAGHVLAAVAEVLRLDLVLAGLGGLERKLLRSVAAAAILRHASALVR